MIPVSLVRKAIKERFVLDKYTLSNVAERLARVVSDVSELTAARIEGMIVAAKRHENAGETDRHSKYAKATNGALGLYTGRYKDTKESVNAEIRSKLIRL